MSEGRTTWRAKPCGWRDRERVVALGDEFGPAGPLVLDVLEELAKEQRSGGHVRTGLRSLARSAFLPSGSEGVDLARQVVTFAERVGALDDVEIAGDSGMTVTCRVSGFAADQGAGYEAVRKASQRTGTTRDKPGQRPENGDNVPSCPPTGQDRTEEPPPNPPAGGNRRRDKERERDSRVEQAAAWIREEHPQTSRPDAVTAARTALSAMSYTRAGLEATDKAGIVAKAREWRPDLLEAEGARRSAT